MAAGLSRLCAGFAFACLLAVSSLGLLVRAQSQPQQPTFSTTSQAIVVDVVVRDGRGRPVTDLAAEDFDLFEDGVRQQIASVSLTMPGAAGASATAAKSAADVTAAVPAQTPTPAPAQATPAGVRVPISRASGVVAMVFDRLSPEARGTAYQGAHGYVDRLAPGDMMGVFLIDRTLESIQGYTNDKKKLHAAVEDVSRRATSNFRRESYTSAKLIQSPGDTLGYAVNGDNDPSTPVVASAESVGRANNDLNGDGALAAGMYLKGGLSIDRAELAFERLSRDEQGYTTTNGLMALAHSLALLPGRKTLIFMAEQLTVPPDVLQYYQDAVAVANRANVSVYAIDCEALRVQSGQQETARYINGIGMASIAAQSTGVGSGTLTAMELNEDALRRDPRVMLTNLTRDTGGFLINSTNDIASGLERVDADRRFHYLLTYAPTNSVLDGSYRHISVKVRRTGLDVRARDGYLAVPQLLGLPVLQRDALAVAALAQVPRPIEIPIRALPLQFLDETRHPIVALVIDVPRQGVTHQIDANSGKFQTDFTIYAHVVDSHGEIVRKASQAYRLSGPAADRVRAQAGDILFYRQPALPAGHYMLEYVVVDALGHRAGSGSQAVDVDIAPTTTSRPSMSSLFIVQHGDNIPAAQRDAHNPLLIGDVLLSPNVPGTLHKTIDQTLTFFYTAYPGDRPLTATLDLLAEQTTLAHLPLTLPAPDKTGRIQHLARLPLANVPAGSYSLRVTLTDGHDTLSRTTNFVLAPNNDAASLSPASSGGVQ